MRKSPPYSSIQIFESPFLESFTHVPVFLPMLVWAPVVVYFLWRGATVDGLSPAVIFGMVAAGGFVWTLMEYVLHRFIFHFHPRGRMQERLQFIMHGMHHDDANDPTRLVMAPIVALGLAGLFYSLFVVIFGAHLVNPFFSGFVSGYLVYDYTHFYIHHFKPKTAYGKALKRNHMLHHFSKTPVRWGVSSPLWDHVFGTFRKECAKE